MKSMFNVLFSAAKTFERLREKGSFAVPFIVSLIVTLITSYLTMPLVEAQLNKTQFKGASEAAIKTSAHVSAFVSPLVGYAVVMFVGALLFMLINTIIRGQAKYMQLVQVMILAHIPILINKVISGILVRTTDAASAKAVSISAAVFVQQKTGAVYYLLSLLNPFIIWSLVLAVIGLAVMARTSKAKTSYWFIGGWIIYQLIMIGIAAGSASMLHNFTPAS